jgi:hypothetical protein
MKKEDEDTSPFKDLEKAGYVKSRTLSNVLTED